MPIEAGATYVFDLGYYDYGWWAELDRAGCRIVTRLKSNTPFEVAQDRAVPPGSSVRSDRTGYLPKRLAASRCNPMPGLVREVRVTIETGKVLRIFTNDLDSERARDRRPLQAAMGHRAVLPMGQADLEDQPLPGDLRKRRSHSDHDCADRLPVAAPRPRCQQNCCKPAHLRPAHPGQSDGAASDRRPPSTSANLQTSAATRIRLRPHRHPRSATAARYPSRDNQGRMTSTNRAGRSWVKPGHDELRSTSRAA